MVTHIKNIFLIIRRKLINKVIEYFKKNLFMCVQTLLIWSCDHGRIPLGFSLSCTYIFLIYIYIYEWLTEDWSSMGVLTLSRCPTAPWCLPHSWLIKKNRIYTMFDYLACVWNHFWKQIFASIHCEIKNSNV